MRMRSTRPCSRSSMSSRMSTPNTTAGNVRSKRKGANVSPAMMTTKSRRALSAALAALVLPAVLGAQSPTGTWSIELRMDSAGTLGPRPTARVVHGVVRFDTLHVDSGVAPNGNHWTHRYWPGRFAIDLTPFFGGPIGQDVSTTIMSPFDASGMTEV